MGIDIDYDGKGMMYYDIDNNCNGTTSDEVDDDGYGAMGYNDDDDDGDGCQRRQRQRTSTSTMTMMMTTIPAQRQATRATIPIAMTVKLPVH